jgi:hypothetical protein
MGAAAFWICMAAIIVAAHWKKKHDEAMRHETLRLVIEKNPNLDQAQIAELLKPKPIHSHVSPPPPWSPKPGDGRKVFRILGSIVMFVALGLCIAAAWRSSLLGIQDASVVDMGTAIPIVALVGAGLFCCSFFVSKPQSDKNED